jgi:glycogen synthase
MDARRSQRVLMTADTLGGVWSYAVELARVLDQRGVRVALATMGAPLTADQRSHLAGLRTLTLHESSYKLEWMQRAWDDVDRAGEWLLALEREYQPDLVHLNQFAFGALPFAAPTLVVAHSCVLSWWRAVHGKPTPPAWDAYRRRVSRGLAGASLVAAPTRAMLQTLVRNYGYAHAAFVIGNGRSPTLFKPAHKQHCILGAGRLWDEGKNLGALQAVAPQLPWPVRLAGSIEHPDGGKVLPSWVYCLGELPVEALARHLSVAAIYALPARYEPFGLSVLEAALCECALVLGDIPSLREIWGPAALYVAPDDHAALRDTLCRLIDEPAERLRLGAAARTRALYFTPRRMADAYLGAYALLQPVFASLSVKEMQCA